MRNARNLLAAMIAALAALPAVAQDGASPAAKPESLAEALARGDRLEEEGQFSQAITLYYERLDGHEAEVRWRLSRAYGSVGELAPPENQEAQYDKAIEHGRKAIEADPKSSDAHAWLAAALGKKALYAEAKKGVQMSKEIKEEAEKAIALDPKNFIPYIVLGIWNREIANLGFLERAGAKILYGGLPPASNEDSVKMLEKALALRPDSLKARYELGQTYISMGEYAKAKRELQKVIELPKVVALDDKIKKSAAEVLKKLGG